MSSRPATPVDVTDHAVLRFLECVYGVDVELVRHEIAAATAQGRDAAALIGEARFQVVIDRLRFAVVDGAVVTATVTPKRPSRHSRARRE